MNTQAPVRTATQSMLSAGLLIAGIVVAILGGFGSGSILGAVLAAAGCIPALWGMWLGIQNKTQTQMVGPVLLLLACAGTAALLIVLKVVAWAT